MKFNRIWNGKQEKSPSTQFDFGTALAVMSALTEQLQIFNERTARILPAFESTLGLVGQELLPPSQPEQPMPKNKRGRKKVQHDGLDKKAARREIHSIVCNIAKVTGRAPESVRTEFYGYVSLDIGFNPMTVGKETKKGKKDNVKGLYIQTVENRGKLDIALESARRYSRRFIPTS
jgi:hypothetical protein